MTAADKKELKLLDNASREFSKKELAPEREENDKYPFGPFFSHILDKAYELDFFHITLPEAQGGVGHDIGALCVILDNLCQEDSSLGGIIFTNAFAQEIFLAAGAGDMLQEITGDPGAVKDFLLACPVLCNPSESPLLVNAAPEGDPYTLSGSADYVVLGEIASKALIPARLDHGPGLTWFLVDLNDAAISKSDTVMSHGMHGCPAVDVELRNAPGRPVGEINQGGAYFDKAASRMQLAAASMASGIMKGALNESLAYCRERNQGGRKIKDWSEMQMLLANMALRMEVADMLVSRACQAVSEGENNWETKVQAASLHILSETTALTTDAIQSMGGVGYMKDFGQEKRFRDAGHVQALLGHFPTKKINFIKRFL